MLRKAYFRKRPVFILESIRVPLHERLPHLNYYEMRHGGDDTDIPYTIEYGEVVVNFWGTLVSSDLLLSKRWKCVDLNAYYRRQFMFGGEGLEIYNKNEIKRVLHEQANMAYQRQLKINRKLEVIPDGS